MAINPGTAAVISAGIQAGSGLLGSVFGGGGRSTADKILQGQQAAWNTEAFQQLRDTHQERHYKIRNMVFDAKQAGLHPVFALGGVTGGGSIGPSFIPGQSESGSTAGDAVRGIGESVAAGVRDYAGATKKPSSMEQRIQAAQLRRVEAEALLFESQAALSTQKLNQTRPAVTLPLGKDKPPPSLEARPWEHGPRRSEPATLTAVGPKGRREVLNPELGLDELGQVQFAVEPWVEYFTELLRDFTGGPGRFARPSMKNPRAYYHYWKNRLGR